MQQFVVDISGYAKQFNPSFMIIPQNGVELAFNQADTSAGLHSAFMSAIDGFGVEELFYNGDFTPDNERLAMLRQIKGSRKILVSEYISDEKNVADAISRNINEGFICFPRVKTNYDYTQIPDSVMHANATDILNLSMIRNYLYLIGANQFSSKQVMIQALAKTNYDLIIMDLFFDDSSFSKAEVNQLKRKANGGRRLLVSYISIGSAEKYRYYFKNGWGLHHPLWLRRKYDGYKDEYWVKFWNPDWQNIIYGNENSYIKRILDAGFDGAYLDNVEAYYFLYFRD